MADSMSIRLSYIRVPGRWFAFALQSWWVCKGTSCEWSLWKWAGSRKCSLIGRMPLFQAISSIPSIEFIDSLQDPKLWLIVKQFLHKVVVIYTGCVLNCCFFLCSESLIVTWVLHPLRSFRHKHILQMCRKSHPYAEWYKRLQLLHSY